MCARCGCIMLGTGNPGRPPNPPPPAAPTPARCPSIIVKARLFIWNRMVRFAPLVAHFDARLAADAKSKPFPPRGGSEKKEAAQHNLKRSFTRLAAGLMACRALSLHMRRLQVVGPARWAARGRALGSFARTAPPCFYEVGSLVLSCHRACSRARPRTATCAAPPRPATPRVLTRQPPLVPPRSPQSTHAARDATEREERVIP